jgi:hypothetical protein
MHVKNFILNNNTKPYAVDWVYLQENNLRQKCKILCRRQGPKYSIENYK